MEALKLLTRCKLKLIIGLSTLILVACENDIEKVKIITGKKAIPC
jgi:hypothetical protein